VSGALAEDDLFLASQVPDHHQWNFDQLQRNVDRQRHRRGRGDGGTQLVVTFNASATAAAVSALLQSISYLNSGGDNPTEGSRTVNWTLVDPDGTANGGANTLTFSSAINVIEVNDEPAGSDHTATINEDSTYAFAATDFGFSDTDGNSFSSVRFTTLPGAGTIFLDTDGPGGAAPIAVGAGNIVALSEDQRRPCLLRARRQRQCLGYASFTFQVRDSGGTLNGGIDLDQSPNTFTIDVTAVNDAPGAANRAVDLPRRRQRVPRQHDDRERAVRTVDRPAVRRGLLSLSGGLTCRMAAATAFTCSAMMPRGLRKAARRASTPPPRANRRKPRSPRSRAAATSSPGRPPTATTPAYTCSATTQRALRREPRRRSTPTSPTFRPSRR
jgi:hypothetical protein